MQPLSAHKRLESLPTLARAGKPINGLFRLLSHRPLWVEALARIRSNIGAGTPGVDGLSVLDLDQVDIEAAIQSVVDRSYRPQPVRRVYIPKANGKLRPLGIPTALDRLVQEVTRSILNEIYEPIFSDHSHGFREERSCHTALKSVGVQWTSVKWFVEVDIKGFFDNINHSVLLALLGRRINDSQFLALIAKMLKAGFLEQWTYHDTFSGTPQGGIVSPLLANIYLHELDDFMSNRIRNFDKGSSRKRNPAYHRLEGQVYYARKRANQLRATGRNDEAQKYIIRHRAIREELLRTPSADHMDGNYRRLRYIRYADDFLIGIIGSKAEARQIMQEVTQFLADTLHLQIAEAKSGISAARDGVQFLGYDIRSFTGPKIATVLRGGRSVTQRSMVERIQLSVPRGKVSAFAAEKGYGVLATMEAIRRNPLLSNDDAEIAQVYNAELRGFANYYALARDVKQKLGKLAFLWSGSLLKTIASRHRTSATEVARRFRVRPGHYVVRSQYGDKVVEVPLWRLADLRSTPNTHHGVDHCPKVGHLMGGRNSLTIRLAARVCLACEGDGPFHIHHTNPLRNLKDGPHWRFKASARSRKTVVLCVSCHKALHAGRAFGKTATRQEGESRVQ